MPAVLTDVSTPSARAAAAWSWRLGLVLVVVCSGLSFTGAKGDSLAADGAWIGVVFVAFGLASSGQLPRLSVPRLVVIAGAFYLYFKYVFAGAFGRLVVASLAMAVAITICRRFKGRMVKVAALALIIPALAVAGQLRVNFIQQRYGSAAPANINGLGSLTAPLQYFGEEIQLHEAGGLSLAHGSTFVATSVLLVPRAVWASKPIGFGAVLTEIFVPSEQSAHLSLAALSAGEWYYDFGNFGLVAMIAALGLFVRYLDDLMARCGEAPLDRRGLLGRVAVITATAGLTDLFWTGSFTYAARTGPRLLLILGILLLFAGASTRARVIEAIAMRHRSSLTDAERSPPRSRTPTLPK